MTERRTTCCRMISFALAAAISTFLARTAQAHECEEIRFSMGVAGQLCADPHDRHQTLQLLVHGATYNRSYWDFSVRPEQYSYVRYAQGAGFATLALDRLGAGASDHPPGLTTTSSALTLHQIVTALRQGTATTASGRPVRFDRILLVGHSFGTYISWLEAGTFGDVDGLIASGASHLLNPPGQAVALGAIYPAAFDPKFAAAGFPADYLTTVPGTRATLFYYAANADPAVIAADEATKDVVSAGFFSDQTAGFGLTGNIHVPVLGVVGDFDTLACDGASCSSSGSFASEAATYPSDACFTPVVLPNAGHDLNLHRNAPVWFTIAQGWALSRVGVRSNLRAPHPCR
jgi:pimeloyl-ACP methyl ester carboxylesterase